MTEVEWLSCSEPDDMLLYLRGQARSWKQRALIWLGFEGDLKHDRKLRLFACACCRRIWDSITDPRSRRAVEASEAFADQLITVKQLEAAAVEASLAWWELAQADERGTWPRVRTWAAAAAW